MTNITIINNIHVYILYISTSMYTYMVYIRILSIYNMCCMCNLFHNWIAITFSEDYYIHILFISFIKSEILKYFFLFVHVLCTIYKLWSFSLYLYNDIYIYIPFMQIYFILWEYILYTLFLHYICYLFLFIHFYSIKYNIIIYIV